MRSSSFHKAAAPASLPSFELMAVHHFRHRLAGFMHGGPLLIVVIGDVSDVHPGVRHLVDGALTPADPLVGVGIVWVGGGVVMPGGNAEYRALWKHWRRVLCVNVIIHP